MRGRGPSIFGRDLGGFEPMRRDTVAKTLTFTKLPDGKFKALGGTWDQEAHFLDDQGARGSISGRPASLPSPPVLDPENMPASMKDAIGWE